LIIGSFGRLGQSPRFREESSMASTWPVGGISPGDAGSALKTLGEIRETG
jgi:hypothetical protein